MASSASGKPPGKRRGRKGGVKVPCDECIARASSQSIPGTNIELCVRCTAVLQRPQKPKETAGVRKVRQQSSAIVDAALGGQTGPIEVPWSEDRREQHALQFFIRNSAPQLAGYFDSPFWQRMVLQAGRHEPAVKHAIAAIGSLHEKLLKSPDNSGDSADAHFALEQCNKSIQHLVKPAEAGKSPDLRLMLTTCVLFTCFEALQGHCEQAIRHATQGYSIIQHYAMHPESKQWDVGSFAVELDQLTLMMRRLQTQSKGLMGKDLNNAPDVLAISAPRPSVFHSLHEAREGLELVLSQLTVFFMNLELDDHFYDMAVSNAEKHLLFSPWLVTWETAFSDYLARAQPQMTPADRKAAMILKAHHLVAEILAGLDLSLGEIGWDAHHSKFSAIVDLAGAVLDGTKEGDISKIDRQWKTSGMFISSPTATLSFSLGIVDPLYEVCARCRDPTLRRRALDLLARHPRQECMWSSWSAWKVGRFLMNLEEDEGAQSPESWPSEIPAERRISAAWLDFSQEPTVPGRSGKVAYTRAVPRAKPRYALNPGLFEDLRTDDAGFTNVEAATVPLSARSVVGAYASLVPEATAITPITPSEFVMPAWVDFKESANPPPG